jgi:replicative DNA helicase
LNGEGGPRATETANQLAKVDATSLGQIIPPVGPHPTAGIVFLGALLWSTTVDAADVLALIRDDDMATPSQESVLAAIRRLVDAGMPPGPQLALDELRRVGTLKHIAARDLADATTSGAAPMALRQYAAAALSEALRRRIESAAMAFTEAAADAVEEDLAPLMTRALASCLDCADRLAQLRGEAQ